MSAVGSLCRLLLARSTCSCSTSRPSTRRRERRLVGALPPGVFGTVVAITHDRYFLDNAAQWILELDRGRGFPSRATTPAGWKAEAGTPRPQEKTASARQRTLNEPEWVRWPPRLARQRARLALAAYDKLQAEAEASREDTGKLEIIIPAGPRLGDTVIEVNHLNKGVRGSALVEDLSFSLPLAGIVGIIGPNGAGKTTLFKMLAGQEQPDAGLDHDRRHGPVVLRGSGT
ncbi:MAG: ATP-binding cassette domain-containing protein [Ilumatobacteraceae bacterium]